MKKTLLATAILASLLAACSSTPPATTQKAEAKPGTATTTATETKPAEPAKADPWAALKDPNSILSKRSVYFDFDKYNVKDEYKEMLEAHATFIKLNEKAKVLIQGNADERGSREYNLALGQKRAAAVKQTLSILGVKEDQLEAVSLGEEKPRNEGHDEAAWTENRRGDILYNGEY